MASFRVPRIVGSKGLRGLRVQDAGFELWIFIVQRFNVSSVYIYCLKLRVWALGLG